MPAKQSALTEAEILNSAELNRSQAKVSGEISAVLLRRLSVVSQFEIQKIVGRA